MMHLSKYKETTTFQLWKIYYPIQ